ncbi:MAG: hypothetical protein ACREJ3_04140 [Polyangiaceae bacterium]
MMDEKDVEGTLVLEQLASIGMVEEFFNAIDSDDADRAKSLMKRAKVDAATIVTVVRKMADSYGEQGASSRKRIGFCHR